MDPQRRLPSARRRVGDRRALRVHAPTARRVFVRSLLPRWHTHPSHRHPVVAAATLRIAPVGPL